MSAFRLSGKALRDVAEILAFLHGRHGTEKANKFEDDLFAVFSEIASSTSTGHRRDDLTAKNILFHYAEPHFILFRRLKERTEILRVAHKSRDLKRFV